MIKPIVVSPNDNMKTLERTFLKAGLVMKATMTSRFPAKVKAATTEQKKRPVYLSTSPFV